MAIDLVSYLANLKVVDVWKPGNASGLVTDRRLYEDKVRLNPPKGMVAHGTAAAASNGLNSLAYLAGGSIADGRWVSADQYIPKNGTLYNLIPTDRYCWHAGYGHWNGIGDININFWGRGDGEQGGRDRPVHRAAVRDAGDPPVWPCRYLMRDPAEYQRLGAFLA